MSAAVKLVAAPPRPNQSRVPGRCPYCGDVLWVPRRYNAVYFCPVAKRTSLAFPNALRFNLRDGHRMTIGEAPPPAPRRRFRLFARLRAAWAAWKAAR